MEEEAKQKMEYLREKANEAIKEQNEEIKEINKVLYGFKYYYYYFILNVITSLNKIIL